MEFNFKATCAQILTKCSEYYEAAATKAEAFCRTVKNSEVYQKIMGQLERLDHWARGLWTPIKERRATESEAVRNIREKYSNDESTGMSFAEGVRQAAREREERSERVYRDEIFHVRTYNGMDEFLAQNGGQSDQSQSALAAMREKAAKHERAEELLQQLLEQQTRPAGKGGKPVDMRAFKLVQQKTALLNDLAQKMDARTELDTVALMEDLLNCKDFTDIGKRLVQKDVPKGVRKELQEKLRKLPF